MTLRIQFDLDEGDLRHFRRLMREARSGAKDIEDEIIIESAEGLLEQVRGATVPTFVAERLETLGTLIDMLRDEEWQIPARERKRVLTALTYFAEPEDLIPDHIPALGFLDDAIMIELVSRELRHEIEAYHDFCEFREAHKQLPKRERMTEEARERFARKRKALHERMRRRSMRRRRSRRSSGVKLSLF